MLVHMIIQTSNTNRSIATSSGIYNTMQSSLLELPNECICAILSFLRSSQVKRIALTFNHRLLVITKPFLGPLTKIKKDEAYFESLFGRMDVCLCFYTPRIYEEYLECLNFTNLPISVPFRVSHHMEHLDLKDDLSWFEDVAKEDARDFKAENGCVVNHDTDGKKLKKLIETTTRLGLTLPQSFIKLLKSEHLLEKLPTRQAWYIDLSPVFKIRKQLENDPTRYEDGYIFTWFQYSDPEGSGYNHLYLNTNGRHAVLGSGISPAIFKEEREGVEEDWLNLTDDEKREDIVAIDSGMVEYFVLEDVDFERWLVNHYYAERLCFLDYRGGEDGERSPIVPDHMKKHFYYLYTEEGRRMQ